MVLASYLSTPHDARLIGATVSISAEHRPMRKPTVPPPLSPPFVARLNNSIERPFDRARAGAGAGRASVTD